MSHRYFLVALSVYLLFSVAFFRVESPKPAVAAAPRHKRTIKVATAKVARSASRRKHRTLTNAFLAKYGKHAVKTRRSRWDRNLHAQPTRGTFRRYYRMTATAYAPINNRMEGGRWTKTERDGRSAHGVAVDPRLIPLGSRLWIPGYGHAVADDTGGAIKGHRIDLRMQRYKNVTQWGRRKVRVYVLGGPKKRTRRG